MVIIANSQRNIYQSHWHLKIDKKSTKKGS